MNWEDQYRRWTETSDANPYDDRPARLIVIETRRAARNQGDLDCAEGWEWVSAATRDAERRIFVHAVFHRQAAPKQLVPLFLKLAIEERNPSANRLYVEPAAKAIGARRMMERLTELLRNGSDDERGGAVSAAYWVQGDPDEPRYREARARFRDEMLRQFVANENVHVRQRIVPMLSMDAADYLEAGDLIPAAIHIARAHPDGYIRHRIEVQLGTDSPLQPLPR